jgi:uncharacterized membrane protein YgcG
MKRLAAWTFGRLLLAAALFLPLSARAQGERVLRYDSRIEVQTNASLVVTETLRVRATGDQIKHGIYRDFPQLYRSGWGLRQRTGFDVLSVRRDGRPEEYHLEGKDNGQRVYIGSAQTTLDPGEYTFELTYRTDRQLGFFENHDELYWNVTGNGWIFPLDKVTATILLPPGCPVQSTDAYTGPKGAKGRDYTASQPGPGTACFETTRPLDAYEGLTIVVAWPKGYVATPDPWQARLRLVRDNIGLALALVGLALVLVYYVVAWSRVGKDPEKGVIIPRYAPPRGFSPAAVRFLMRMGYDQKAFAANVISLAVKGVLTIHCTDKKYTLMRKQLGLPGLTEDEKDLAQSLLGTRARLELEQANHTAISSAIKILKSDLAVQLEKKYFLSNIRYWVPGLLFSLVPCAVSLLNSRELPVALFMLVWLSIWTVGVTALLSSVFTLWRTGHWVQAIPMTLFSLPFVIGEIAGLGMFGYATSFWVPLVFGLGALVNGIFFHLLKAPTLIGRKTMDEIEGFRLYLSVAEKDRLNLENPPHRTPELFEMFLPYALALGVEQRWSEQFKDVLDTAAKGTDGYSPAWYAGAGLTGLTAGALAGSLGSSLSSAISSSSTAPGSSSGGGGGGSSGGGGGGGGGGGW